MVDSLSNFPNNWNQKATQEYNYITETMSEINDTEELSKGKFPINFKIIDQYQQKYPGLMAKFKTGKYKSGYFVE